MLTLKSQVHSTYGDQQVTNSSPKPRLSLLRAQVYHFAVKGLRKYFSTYHTRTCGLFYDSRTSSICKAVSHRVVVQQSSSNIYLYCIIAEPLYFF